MRKMKELLSSHLMITWLFMAFSFRKILSDKILGLPVRFIYENLPHVISKKPKRRAKNASVTTFGTGARSGSSVKFDIFIGFMSL